MPQNKGKGKVKHKSRSGDIKLIHRDCRRQEDVKIPQLGVQTKRDMLLGKVLKCISPYKLCWRFKGMDETLQFRINKMHDWTR